jgi:hypothetical protein
VPARSPWSIPTPYDGIDGRGYKDPGVGANGP